MRDWCTIDTPGVIDWAARTYPEPAAALDRPQPGRLRHRPRAQQHAHRPPAQRRHAQRLLGPHVGPERYRVRVLMGAVAPIVVRLAGYFPGWLMGGEDMPGPAFLEWTRWCMDPEFIFGDPTLTEAEYLAQFRAPIRFAQIEDDVWGTPAAVEHIAEPLHRQRRAIDLAASASPTPARQHRPPRLLPRAVPRHALARRLRLACRQMAKLRRSEGVRPFIRDVAPLQAAQP